MPLEAFLALFPGPTGVCSMLLPFSITALFCNDLMEELELNPATRVMWRWVKPMLMGQILYAPDSPAVRQIIKNVSGSCEERSGELCHMMFTSITT